MLRGGVGRWPAPKQEVTATMGQMDLAELLELILASDVLAGSPWAGIVRVMKCESRNRVILEQTRSEEHVFDSDFERITVYEAKGFRLRVQHVVVWHSARQGA